MAEHPAVVFLRQALDRAEERAQRLHDELWWIGNVTRIEAFAGDIQFDDIRIHGEGGTRTVSITEAIQRGLLAGNPVDLKRRVAADRQILAEHANDYGDCAACGRPSEETNGRGHHFHEAVPWPCRTVLLLAEAYGWTEEPK